MVYAIVMKKYYSFNWKNRYRVLLSSTEFRPDEEEIKLLGSYVDLKDALVRIVTVSPTASKIIFDDGKSLTTIDLSDPECQYHNVYYLAKENKKYEHDMMMSGYRFSYEKKHTYQKRKHHNRKAKKHVQRHSYNYGNGAYTRKQINELNKTNSDSLLELKVNHYLKHMGIPFVTQEKGKLKCVNPKTRKRMCYDFELTNDKVVIEVQGKQHYELVPKFGMMPDDLLDRKQKDVYKKEFAELHGYKEIQIPYTAFTSDEYKRILDNEIGGSKHDEGKA